MRLDASNTLHISIRRDLKSYIYYRPNSTSIALSDLHKMSNFVAAFVQLRGLNNHWNKHACSVHLELYSISFNSGIAVRPK